MCISLFKKRDPVVTPSRKILVSYKLAIGRNTMLFPVGASFISAQWYDKSEGRDAGVYVSALVNDSQRIEETRTLTVYPEGNRVPDGVPSVFIGSTAGLDTTFHVFETK